MKNNLGLLIAIIISSCSGSMVLKKPLNLVVIVADDLGYYDLDRYSTPNIDHLFSKGFVFENFYTAPLCTPTRMTLHTGYYPQRFGRRFDNALNVQYDTDIGMPDSTNTLFEMLQNGGYKTALFGKWHLGWGAAYSPIKTGGFDTWIGCYGGEIDFQSKVNGNGDYDWYKDDQRYEQDGYVTNLIAENAQSFIQENPSSKFALYLPFTAPHWPIQGPTDPAIRFEGGIPGKDWERQSFSETPEKSYKQMVETLDASVGVILDELEKENQLDNTLIVFFSDNGLWEKVDFISTNKPLKNFKGSLWEGGILQKCLFYCPSIITPGSTPQRVHVADVAPTILDILNLNFPERDGVSLKKTILADQALEERAIPQRRNTQLSIHKSNWKLLFYDGEYNLFDLTADPYETTNLIEQRVGKYEELKSDLDNWLDQIPEY